MSLLDPAFLARLERLKLLSHQAAAGRSVGEHRARSKGASVEFADHREYRRGDDPRALDWNAYARLGKLFVKLYRHESELTVHLILDASASMSFGAPPKLEFAKRLAAAVAHVAGSSLDRVGLKVLGRGGPLRPSRGPGWTLSLLRALEDVKAGGRPDPLEELRLFAAAQRRPGLCVVLSDFLDPRYPEALKPLLAARHELRCVQTLAAEDEAEALAGDVRLVDCETGEHCEATVTPRAAAAYRDALRRHGAGIRKFCGERRAPFLSYASGAELETALLGVLGAR